MQKERLYYLDFIRAISAIGIIIYHFNCSIAQHMVYGGENDIIFSFYKNGNLGQIGVSLFFILSGASLMYNYGENICIKEYAKKRWLGIFPMYYIAWGCAVFFYMFRYYSLNPFCIVREKWTIILTFLGLDGYLCDVIPNYYLLGEWFLGCILIMYVLFPFLRKIMNRFNPLLVLLGYMIIYIIVVQNYNLDFNIEFFVFTRLLEFIFGMVLIKYIKKVNIWIFGISLGVVILWLSLYININQMYKTTIMGMSLYVVFMFLGQVMGKKGHIIFGYISKYSYAIFLCHHIVLDQICTRFDHKLYGEKETYVILGICMIIIFLVAKLLFCLHKKVIEVFKLVKNEFKTF